VKSDAHSLRLDFNGNVLGVSDRQDSTRLGIDVTIHGKAIRARVASDGFGGDDIINPSFMKRLAIPLQDSSIICECI